MLIKRFEEQVEKRAASTAVKFGKQSYTYEELNRWANRTADLITREWPKKNKSRDIETVGLLLDHGPVMIAAILGTLKAGKAYVPISTDYPEKRISYMLSNSESSLILSSSAHERRAKQLAAANKIDFVNIEAAAERGLSEENPHREDIEDRVAYIMYTSGSTGWPKGVVQTHSNATYYIRNWTRVFSITASDRMTLFSSFCHDGSVQDMFGALHNGAALYPFDMRSREESVNLSDFLIEEKITIWHSVPSLFTFFAGTLDGRYEFKGLRFILLGGEAVREHEVNMFKEFFPYSTLANVYGQTESSVNSICLIGSKDAYQKPLIGEPLDETQVFVVDKEGEEVDELQVGEILVGSRYITPGYWKNPEESEKRFTPDEELGTLYWTGDQGRLLLDGSIEFMGRKDRQVKIRGFRVEVGEIESRLLQQKKVEEAVVLAKVDEKEGAYLCAYIVPRKPGTGEDDVFTISEMREYLTKELPDYMVPSYLVRLEKMPLTQSNKIDRKGLPEPGHIRPRLGVTYAAPAGSLEKDISKVWKEVLKLDKVGINDNFFDLGGTSFNILNIVAGLKEVLAREFPVVALFRYPTISSFAGYLEGEGKKTGSAGKIRAVKKLRSTSPDVAVIGMAGRFPGAGDIAAFWENLKAGVESISFFTTGELAERGVDRKLLQDPAYVKAKGVLEDIEYFDASFFNYSPVEARMMDPQLRILHESCWEALEDAGYDPGSYEGSIGLYAGNAPNQYWSVLSYINRKEGLDTGFLNSNYSTKVSYKLDLRGPSLIVQTACSTSLVAIHLACRGLIDGECDMALAGGVSINLPDKEGYLYREGMILSPDGHCRAFDAAAGGTVFGNGAGIVVLKRLEDAVGDGDTISAVIKGSAINNDGSRKVGVTAPSVEGQAEVITAARQAAGVDPGTIGYIEAHGTGTILGDPIEIEALKLTFDTGKKGNCGIGSVKTNVGHLNAASGVTGFIKAVLSLKHRLLPPTLHFDTPNPRIDFEDSPFSVVKELTEWKTGPLSPGQAVVPLRAGVSAFGIGGTNAHVVLEEWQSDKIAAGEGLETGGRPYKLILLSARTPSALDKMSENFARHLKENPGIDIADAAYTLQLGRKAFKHRRMLVSSTSSEVPEKLLQAPGAVAQEGKKAVIFMFPGQAAQYVDMARELYESEPGFREEMDRCFEILKESGLDIKAILYPEQQKQHPAAPASEPDKPDKSNSSVSSVPSVANSDPINNTEIAQPLIFAVQYALAKQLMSWGIEPYALIGHSIGEYAAACLSGVFSLPDALGLVVLRGKLMQGLPSGSMLSVPLPEEELRPLLKKKLSLAAVNSPVHCVVSGAHEDIDAFAGQLKEAGHEGRKLHTSHAFHSQMMEPILEEFRQAVSRVTLNKPGIPYVSNVGGGWISLEEAQDPAYWARHIRSAVRFNDGILELLKAEKPIFVEIGPGRTLSTFVKQHKDKQEAQKVIHLIKHPREKESDSLFLLSKLGQLWLYGVKIDWRSFHGAGKRRRIPLPTYPFERQRYWLEGNPYKIGAGQPVAAPEKKKAGGRKTDMADWFYVPTWEQAPLIQQQSEKEDQPVTGLFFGDDSSLSSRLWARLKQEAPGLATVRAGQGFAALKDNEYTIDPGSEADYLKLLESLDLPGDLPLRIVHSWNAAPSGQEPVAGSAAQEFDSFDSAQDRGFYSLLNLSRAIGKLNMKQSLEILVITSEVQAVRGDEVLSPGKATVMGAVQVVSREYPQIRCRTIDIESSAASSEADEGSIENLLSEITAGVPDMHTAYRGKQRWKRTFKAERIGPAQQEAVIKEKGVYLVTGGLGGIGLVLAEFLAESYNARLILTDFSPLPAREEWQERLESGDETGSIYHKISQVLQLESYGAEVAVFSADAADMEQMETVVSRAEKRFGPVNGVIHAAGIAGGGLIQIRAKELSEKVFAPKVKGAIVLDAIFRDRQLDFMMLCSSISSVLAPVGQVAYAAANAYLNAYAQRRTLAGKGFTSAISWDNWSQVGMAVDATARLSGQENMQTPGKSEINQKFFGGSRGAIFQKSPPRRRRQEIDHPLFTGYEIEENGREIFVSHLDVKKHWVLDEHRIGGNSVLPGTAYLEMARAAFEKHAAGKVFELRDVYFLSPLVVGEEEEKEVLTVLEKAGEDYNFSIVSRRGAGREEWIEHARGKAAVLGKTKAKRHDLEALKAECEETINYDPAAYNGESGAMIFGPRWNNVRQVDFGQNQCLGFLELPGEFAAEIDRYKLHPALLDTATTLLRIRMSEEERGSFLPFAYKKITIRAAVPAGVYCYVRAAGSDRAAKGLRRYHITLMDEKGLEIVEIEDFTLKQLKTGAAKSERPAALPQALQDGISSAEGVEIFRRILAGGSLPHVVVSTGDLFERIKRSGITPRLIGLAEQAAATSSGALHSRPELSTAYVPPDTKTEKTLAAIWQEMLGIDKVGTVDDFFELGGDSLKAIAFGGRIHKETDTEVPITEFFNRPTIKELAEFIEDSSDSSILHTIENVEEKEYYPMSAGQRRLYVLQELHKESIGYNIPTVFKVVGNIDRERFEASIGGLIRRHESFRTSFEIAAGEPVQVIRDPDHIEFAIEYYETGSKAKDEEIEKISKAFVRPFDLSCAPLLRVGLIELEKTEHILMIDVNHIVCDGSSTMIFLEEFIRSYLGQEHPPLKIRYKDFAGWANSPEAADLRKKQENFWLGQFAGEIPVLNLPLDFVRPALQSFTGKRLKFTLSEQETGALKAAAGKEEVTLYMLLLAIFNVLFMKLSGQEDIIIGTPTAGRRHPDLLPVIGMFVNTLALRNYPRSDRNFRDFLNELKERTLAAFENQEYQFEELVGKIEVGRDTGRNPLFDVLFRMLNYILPQGEKVKGKSVPLKLEGYEYDPRKASLDLDIAVIDSGNTILFSVDYCTELFKGETVERFLGYFRMIVSSIPHILENDLRLAGIEIMSEAKKKQVMVEFNDTEVDYPRHKTIHGLFEQQAASAPDHTAITGPFLGGGQVSLTYKQLNESAQNLAGILASKGVKPGVIAGLMVERTVAMMVGILGILKTGGAYLPIDPEYPQVRIKYVLDKSGASLLLTQQDLLDSFENLDFEKEVLDINGVYLYESGKNKAAAPAPAVDPTGLAYVIYTSGSTGNPKGVAIEHRNVVNFVKGMTGLIDFVPGKTILALTTISFDIFVLETLLPLLCGIKIVLAGEIEQKDPQAMARVLTKNRVDMLQVTPSRLNLLLSSDEQLTCLQGLAEIMVGGEAFPERLFDSLKKNFRGRIFNMYGPTETTVWSAVKELTGIEKINIGSPIANTQVFIVDKNNRPQPPGIAGELLIGGDGVGRGYLNNPELTAEKFQLDFYRSDKSYKPYKTGEGAAHPPSKGLAAYSSTYTNHPSPITLYRTGDLARWLPSGEIDFLGRLDYQVKIRGFRIELEEIEDRLLSHAGIGEAVVLARGDEVADKYLCAYLVGDEIPGSPALHDYLKIALPDYMIPSYFVNMEELPLTPNGKIDRSALPEPRLETSGEYAAPRDALEKKLAEIWTKVLYEGIRQEVGESKELQTEDDTRDFSIGIDDNFFRLGGQSLRAAAVAARTQEILHVSLPLAEVFKTPTIRALAEYIRGSAAVEFRTIEPASKKEYYPLSSAQKRVFIFQQTHPESTAYNMPEVITLREAVDTEKLAGTFKQLIARHGSLRTSFSMLEDQPVQMVHDDVPFTIEHDSTPGKAVLKHSAIEKKIRNFIRPFDLSQAPLLRVGLLETGKQEHILLFDTHHIVSDGVSLRILVEDFIELYNGKELAVLPLQYEDFSEWQNKNLDSDSLKKQADYWLNRFKGEIPVLDLPLDYPRPPVQRFEGRTIFAEIETGMRTKLVDLSVQNDVTLYMFLLAAFNILLSKYTGQKDIIVGSPVAGRNYPGLENIVGMFINLLLMRNNPGEEKSFVDFLQAVKSNTVQAFDNRDYPFDHLYMQLDLKKEAGRNPLYEVVFALENVGRESDTDAPAQKQAAYGYSNSAIKTDLRLGVLERGDKIILKLSYSSVLFKEETAGKMLQHYIEILDQVITNIDIKLKDIKASHDFITIKPSVLREEEEDFFL